MTGNDLGKEEPMDCTELPRLPSSCVVASMILAFTACIGSAQNPPSQTTEALNRARAATVTIVVDGVAGQKLGSGEILTDNGVIATNAHVIEGARSVTVKLASGESYDAVGVLDYDARLDLALIVIPGFSLPTVSLGNSDSVVVGQRLIAIGAPLGLEQTVTDGLLSAIRVVDGRRLFQVSVPLSHGSSGGPIITEDGRVIALTVSGIRADVGENLNFAIPINYVRGKLGLLAQHTPTPFSQMAYAPVSTVSGVSDAGPGAPALTAVNSNLGLDYSVLDGVEFYQEASGSGGLRFQDRTVYSISHTPEGTLVLERDYFRHVRNQVALLRSIDLADQTLRTVFQIGGANRSSTFYNQAPLYTGVPAQSQELEIDGSRYRYVSAEGPREGDAAPGIVPLELMGAVVAALPDSLPSQVTYWVLDASTSRSQEVTLTVGGRSKEQIPVPATGTHCAKNTPTRDIEVDVVLATRKVATSSESIVLLAHRPHVLIAELGSGAPAGPKCVEVPGLAQAH